VLLGAIAFYYVYLLFWPHQVSRLDISYSALVAQVQANRVKSATIEGQSVSGEFTQEMQLVNDTLLPSDQPVPPADAGDKVSKGTHFNTVIPENTQPDFTKLLQEHNVNVKAKVAQGSIWPTLLVFGMPIVIILGIMWLFGRNMSRGQQNIFSFGRSKAKMYDAERPRVTFADVAGEEEAKGELTEVVDFLKNPAKYHSIGARLPRGILLIGPPGTGKTLLAKAVAGEAGVPFFSVSASEFVEMFVGVGASRVRDLFEKAKASSPSIVFVDELDAVGRQRFAGLGGGNDEREQTLNQLLVEMDGFDEHQNVIVIAATNRPDVLDPALLRPGRFDRQVTVGLPDRRGREAILKIHSRGIPISPEVDLDKIASGTPGFSGADLANLVNEAALLATRRGADAVSLADFTAAVERIVAGLEKKNRLLNPHEREVVAYHEMGHTLVALSLPGSDKVHKVSIIPRGIGALGYTIQRPTEDRFLMTRKELDNKMAVLLGGRAAEEVVYGELSTGAADDLVKVTDIARSIVTRYGMTEELGQVVYEKGQQGFLTGPNPQPSFAERSYGEETAREIDTAVKSIVEQAFRRTVTLLRTKRDMLERGARLLLERETLDEDELEALLKEPVPAE